MNDPDSRRCPCQPQYQYECPMCSGEGCSWCEDGWWACDTPDRIPPDVPCVIVHKADCPYTGGA